MSEHQFMKIHSKSMKRFGHLIKNIGFDKKSYQEEGMDWVLRHELNDRISEDRVEGGIIADEMGLGKTLLMLGAIVSNYSKGDKNLIVLPFALLHQWKKIIETTFKIKPLIYHGTNVNKTSLEDLNDPSLSFIVLTTYGMIAKRPKSKNYTSLLWSVKWKRLICDEAHHLRNMRNPYFGAKKIQASIKWMVTGTPICNNITDLYSLLDVIGVPKKVYLDPMKLEEALEYCLLRRTKDSVGLNKDMPKLHIEYIDVPFEDEDERILSENLHKYNLDESEFDKVIPYISNNILSDLIRARQSCVSSVMIANCIKEKNKKGMVPEDIDINKLVSINSNSKLKAVVKKIKENNNGRKKIIFCNFRYEIKFLETVLRGCGANDFHVESIDGSKTKKVRQNIIDMQPDILILQIQTACEGLNLQCYNEIYFTSPWWNPAIERQAIARAHRLGQKNDVYVYRFMSTFNDVTTPTIDKDIKDIQDYKEDIASTYITVTDGKKRCNHIEDPCDICCVCHEELKDNLVAFKCGHVLHSDCTKTLLKYQKDCPICRKSIGIPRKVIIKKKTVKKIKIKKMIKKIIKKNIKKNKKLIGHTEFSLTSSGVVPIGHTSYSW